MGGYSRFKKVTNLFILEHVPKIRYQTIALKLNEKIQLLLVDLQKKHIIS